MFWVIQMSCGHSPHDDKIANLSVDSIYRTPEEKEKYKILKNQFLEIWFDSSNCYVKEYFKKPKYAFESSAQVKKMVV